MVVYKMIDKLNITIHSKNTKKISYIMFLNSGKWYKTEFNAEGKKIGFFSENRAYVYE